MITVIFLGTGMFIWIGVIAVAILYGLIIWKFDPLRRFERVLATRGIVADAELFTEYFSTADIPAHIPGRVRKIFAGHMGYHAEKLRPDDNLNVYWNDLDMSDSVKELEAEFGIDFNGADLESTGCTIRAVTELIAKKMGHPPLTN